MAHGTTQAALGLGDGAKIGTDGNAADADNTLDALVTAEVLAAEITVDSTNLDGTATTVQAVLEELETQVQTAASTHVSATGAHAATKVSVDSTSLTGTSITVQGALEEIDNVADLAAVATTVATEDAVNLAYRPLWSTLTSDSADVNASEVLVNSGLAVTVGVGTYELECVALVTTAAAADISLKFDGTATVTGTVGVSDIWAMRVPLEGGDGTSTQPHPFILPTSWTTEFVIATTGALADLPFIFKGKLVVTVAGTILLQFTQGTSDASNTHIDKGSFLKLQRVA